MAIRILLLIRYANLLPARQDGIIILPASQHMNPHLPTGIYRTSWQVSRHSLLFEPNG